MIDEVKIYSIHSDIRNFVTHKLFHEPDNKLSTPEIVFLFKKIAVENIILHLKFIPMNERDLAIKDIIDDVLAIIDKIHGE